MWQEQAFGQQFMELPHGLKEGTLATYSRQWYTYLDFAKRHGLEGRIPGKDCPWDDVVDEIF